MELPLGHRVIVCGSRGWNDRRAIAERLAELPPSATVVVGYDPEHRTPRGADRIAYQEAGRLRLRVETHPALWDVHDRYGAVPCVCSGPTCKRAGHRRNEEMAAAGAALCLAFWDGRSPGTADMVERAGRHGIPFEVVLD